MKMGEEKVFLRSKNVFKYNKRLYKKISVMLYVILIITKTQMHGHNAYVGNLRKIIF